MAERIAGILLRGQVPQRHRVLEGQPGVDRRSVGVRGQLHRDTCRGHWLRGRRGRTLGEVAQRDGCGGDGGMSSGRGGSRSGCRGRWIRPLNLIDVCVYMCMRVVCNNVRETKGIFAALLPLGHLMLLAVGEVVGLDVTLVGSRVGRVVGAAEGTREGPAVG